MAVAWFVCPYRTRPRPHGQGVVRYCAMDDHTPAIHGNGGWWAETEILGDRALVKVRAPENVMAGLMLDGFERLAADLDAPLSGPERARMIRIARDAGYTAQEVAANRQQSARDFMALLATRRRKARLDRVTGRPVLDGPQKACRPLASVDAEVRDG